MIKKRQPKNINLRSKDATGEHSSASASSSETTPHSEEVQHGTATNEKNVIIPNDDDHHTQESTSNSLSTSTTTTSNEPVHEDSTSADHKITHSAITDEEENDINSTLEKTKLKQKLRSRPKGMQANLKTGDLFDLDKIKNTSVKRKKEQLNILQGGTQGGLVDRNKGEWIAMKLANMDKKESSSTMSQLGMDLNFTDAELSEQDKRLFEYIREKMKEQGYSYDDNVNINDSDEEEAQQAAASSSTSQRDAKKKSDISVKEILEKEKELYKLPEELKVDKIEIENMSKRRGKRSDPTKQPAKPISEEERQKLLSGAILEVPLSTADKIQNIRETNERVKELEESGQKRKYTYNTASDEYVYTQFKKKFAHRR